ncbi:5-oxoprolinase subunit PxpA [Clostridium sp. WILCCON 0269]|uniref:5-oxoprolinase subunit PxpA n=1 Tax=Candidatus Clostridium eludens TaxID=3381663 RepID=A0ABW8SDK8_9CLOT
MKIDINVDMGESFGRYTLGSDEEVMKYITSANIAAGFHAGDSLVMEKTIQFAKKYNVAVGAHVGLNDKQGFGRREINLTPEELRADVIYQLGALDGFLKVNNLKMQHIKPHGILYRMVSEYEKYVDCFLDTVKEYNPELYVVLPENTIAFGRGKQKELKMVSEMLVDLDYDDSGNWVLERTKKARSPKEVAERALMVAKDKKIETVTGKLIKADAITVCVHGDSPNAVEVVKEIKEVLISNGVELSSISNIYV